MPFRAHPSLAAPVVFGCGHSVCKECAEAMQACDPPVCLLCSLPILTAVDNRALGEFAEQEQDSDSDSAAAAAPLKRQRMAARPPLADGQPMAVQWDLFVRAAAAFHQAAVQAARAQDDVVTSTVACADMFNQAVDGLLVGVEEYRGRWLGQVKLLGQQREKALETQAHLLTVSAGQLGACVALRQAAVASGDEERVWEAAQAAEAMRGLLSVPTQLCTGTRLALLCDLPSGLACLEGATRIQEFEVDAARSSVSGLGLSSFGKGGAVRNVIVVTCMDRHGELADWATLEDADVGVTVEGAANVARAVFTDPGLIQVTYVVEEDGVEEVEVSVSLRGMAVPGGPWRARAGFMAKGVYVTTLLVKDAMDNSGLAISSDGSLMVVSNLVTHQLTVYRTEDGSHVRSFGGYGEGPAEFSGPRNLCMTAHDTVLVVDFGNERIQEVTLEGIHVKFMELEDSPMAVAMHGDVVAVLTARYRISLHNYTTGEWLRSIDASRDDSRDILNVCFAPDGKHLAAAYRHGSIALLSMEDQSVRFIHPPGHCTGAAFLYTGDLTSFYRGGGHVISVSDGTHLRAWRTQGNLKLQYVSAMAVSRNRLYVLDAYSKQVQVFL